MSLQQLQIVCRDRSDPLVRHAATELQRYARLLFGIHPALVDQPDAPCIQLGPGDGVPELQDQDYVLRRTTRGGLDTLICAGGSPRATLWAVYELVEQWGVPVSYTHLRAHET